MSDEKDEENAEETETNIQLINESSETWRPGTITYFGKDSFSILVTGEINEELAVSVCSQILELSTLNPQEPIDIYINSCGGDIPSAFAIYDCLKIVTNPVVTIVMGTCFSANLIILCAGEKRLATPYSLFFYHQPILTAGEPLNSELSIDSLSEIYKLNKARIEELLIKETKMGRKLYKKIFGDTTSLYFDSKKALEYGFINHIIPYINKETPEEEE